MKKLCKVCGKEVESDALSESYDGVTSYFHIACWLKMPQKPNKNDKK
jgi:hypothetical protein